MEGISKTALRGMQNATNKLNESAAKIASGDSADIDTIVDVKQSTLDFKASAKLLKVDEDLQKTALDLMA